MPQLIINNLIINYQTTGSGKINLILLHGWGCDLTIFNQLIKKLDRDKYTLYTLDFPGFGNSKMPDEIWGVGEYARFLKHFLEKLEIDNPVLLGHSFGGRVAIKFASQYPELTQKLILVGSGGIKKELSKKYLLAAKIGKNIFKLPILRNYKNKILEKIGAKDLAQSGQMQDIFKKVVNEDLREDAGKIKVSTLLIYGINDEETPVEYGQVFNKLIAGSELVVVKNAGHYVFLDEEEKFTEKVNKFLFPSSQNY